MNVRGEKALELNEDGETRMWSARIAISECWNMKRPAKLQDGLRLCQSMGGNAQKLGGCLSHGACLVRRLQERKLAERKHGSHLNGLKILFERRLCRVD